MRHGEQKKLFDTAASLPNGLVYRPDFLTPAEEETLLAYIENAPMHHLRFNDHTSKRRGIGFEHRLPRYLVPLQQRIAKWLDVPKKSINEAFVQEYPPGYGIGWHRDRETPLVVGVSLVGWARMRFRPLGGGGKVLRSVVTSTKSEEKLLLPRPVSIELEPRSVYVMQKEIATRWQHSIAPVKALRYSITFRTL